MNEACTAELVVIGAGPAGVAAALEGARLGAETVLIDENSAAGGQVYRARTPGSDSGARTHAEGNALRQSLAASSVICRFRRQVFSVTPDRVVSVLSEAEVEAWKARALVVAPGTIERVVPFPGWTEPGVVGLAAATVLLKTAAIPPSESTVVAGAGPLLAAVATGILDVGSKVVALVDLAAPGAWLSALPQLAMRPELLSRGLGWIAQIRRARVPMLFYHQVCAVRRTDAGLAIEITPVRETARRRVLEAGALAVGHGLTPRSDITSLLGLRHVFDATLGGWIPACDAVGASSHAGVFVAGDGAGVQGAAAAALSGRLAGLAAAQWLGRIDAAMFCRESRSLRWSLTRARRFGRAFAPMLAGTEELVATMPPETVVCRCEDITRAEIDAAITAGAREINQVKAWTRAGMGPCQGRMCEPTVAGLLARHVGGRERAGRITVRVPLRPLPLSLLTGDFTYRDVPIPEAAPL